MSKVYRYLMKKLIKLIVVLPKYEKDYICRVSYDHGSKFHQYFTVIVPNK